MEGWAEAAPRSEEGRGKTASVVSHLSVFFAAILVPLVIYKTEGKRNRYVAHHSREALNFQITYMLAVVAGVVFLIVSVAAFRQGVTVKVVIFIAYYLVLVVLVIFYSIVGAIRASRGLWWRYPILIRFVGEPDGLDGGR